MDALAAVLDGPRARGAFLLRSLLEPPWSLRVQDEAPLTVVAVVRGQAWIVPAAAAAARLQAGDLAIVRGPDRYTVADNPATPPQIVIHPGQRCTTIEGEDLHQAMDLGVRTWGNDRHGSTVLLTGTYQLQGEVTARWLRLLPSVVTLEAETCDSRLISLLSEEIVRDKPGQEAVLDRLLDLLLIAGLRTWLSRQDAGAPAWYRAQNDPVVGPALRMLHNNPAHPWTVAALAAEAGVSRASFARRFREVMGEPPMSFLTDWRLALAADLLHDPRTSVGEVARRVGYGSPYALSTAFRRVRGVSPTAHRQAGATGGSPRLQPGASPR